MGTRKRLLEVSACAFIALFLLSAPGVFANEDVLTLKNDDISVSFDTNGAIESLENKRTDRNYIRIPNECIWEIDLHNPNQSSFTAKSSEQAAVRYKEGHSLEFIWKEINVQNQALSISVLFRVELQEDEIYFSASLKNDSKWLVDRFEFPIVSAIRNGEDDLNYLYWPLRPGERYTNPHQLEQPLRHRYPGYLTMQWFEYGNEKEGLYFASLDRSLQTTEMSMIPDGSSQTIRCSISKQPYLRKGEEWNSSTYIISPHIGDWHVGADKYRTWAKTWMKQEPVPEWVKNSNGWFLAILKQQNGNLLWPYEQIDKILPLAKAQGIHVLSLFGWAIGGHDHLYPDYSPDPNMGTRDDIIESISNVRVSGGWTTLFVNGQLVDKSGDYYQDIGRDCSAKRRDGKDYTEQWRKYHDHPGYVHAVMCPSTQEWSDKLVEFAEYVAGFGADGIMYDQIGFGGVAGYCYDENHDHERPSLSMGPAIFENFQRIQDRMNSINPDFCILSEGLNDAVGHLVDFNHGSGNGYEYKPNSFPALFRYTFPKIIFTNRYSSPIMRYDQACFAFINGLRFDVECRYIPDAILLRTGKRPTKSDYENIWWPPNDVEMLTDGPVDEYKSFLHQLSEIRDDYPVLLNGTFVDTRGFTIDNPEIEARAFKRNTELAVVCWNHSDEAQACSLAAENLSIECVLVPDRTEVDYATKKAQKRLTLQPNEIVVVLFSG